VPRPGATRRASYNRLVIRIAILGSTGSIGEQTLDVARQHPDRLRVVALAAHSSAQTLQQQAREFGVEALALYSPVAAHGTALPSGMEALEAVATHPDADVVVVSVAGVIGLLPTIAAIRAGKRIALASKEVLVAAGSVVMPLVAEHGVTMVPIDSEHSALFQCLQGSAPGDIDSLILTASGGPFRGRTADQLREVTYEDALNHPTWRMGGKITIDSATLMNKGLEMIEAQWLFGAPIDRVEVVVHPQSIVHSLVRFRDGSVLAQLGWPNMRLPIQYALFYPERVENPLRRWNPVDTPALSFERADEHTFRSLALARDAARIGGTMPSALNAANEEAANGFLRGEIGFLRIPEIVEEVMQRHAVVGATLETILATDRVAREHARALMRA
jgi:1-deoxy-D-xylulose-5-phosphate reductoisomerase